MPDRDPPKIPSLSKRFLQGRVQVLIGDITSQNTDAIVNAANSSLLGGGGVDGAIHRRGGPEILAACRRLRATRWPDGLPTGEAAITTAGKLPASYVIHTVGPIYGRHRGQEAELLGACYRNCLQLAHENGLHSLAFPAISTGVYGYPPELAARVVARQIDASLSAFPEIREVRLVFFDERQYRCFLDNQAFPSEK